MDLHHLSTQHLMTHFPTNPKCPVCQRANKKRLTHRRGDGDKVYEATKFGESFTMDFVSNHNDQVEGLRHEREVLIILDHYTRWFQIFPLTGRTSLQVQMCVAKFLGSVKLGRCYSDRAPEFISACKALSFVHDMSNPGKPQSNGLIESYVGKWFEGQGPFWQQQDCQNHFGHLRHRHFVSGKICKRIPKANHHGT